MSEPRFYVEHSDDESDNDAPWLVIDREGGKAEGYPRETRVLAMCYIEPYAKRICDAMTAQDARAGEGK